MKPNLSLYKKFVISSGVLVCLSVLLLALSSVLLFDNTRKVSYESKAFLSNTWTVLGSNTSGQFCNGGTASSVNPIQLQNSGDIIAISGGTDHFLALKNDNTVKSCGANAKGQLGDGGIVDKTSFVNISSLTGIVQVLAGDKISFALNGLGQVYQWGDTVTGISSTPTLISSLSNIVSITTSENTLLALDNSSNLYGYGLNANGESGNGNNLAIISPLIIQTGVSSAKCAKEACAIVKGGSVYTSGNNTKKELADDVVASRSTFGIVNTQRSPNLPLVGISSIASGPTSYNFFALDNSGKVWTWGSANYLGYTLPGNTNGDIARNISSLTNITEISGSYPLALRAGGGLYTWANTTPTMVNGIGNATKINQNSGQTAYIKGDLYNPIDSTDIISLSPTCLAAEVNATTTCTFVLPASKDLPNSLTAGIGNAVPAGNCSGTTTVICINVPVGSVDGISIVYLKIGNQTSVATQATALVKRTVVANSNIGIQSGTCTPGTISQGEFTDCTFPLIGSTSFILPTNGLRAAITNLSGDSSTIIGPGNPCSIQATTLTCTNIVSSLSGNVATLGTHEILVYEPGSNTYFFNKAQVTVNSLIISNSNILPSTDCIDSNLVQLGNDYNCTFGLTGSVSNSYTMPAGGVVAKTSGGTANSPLCTILNNATATVKLSCNTIGTTGATRGIQDVLLKSGSTNFVDKGGVTVQDTIAGTDLGNLNVTCNSGRVSSTTSCSFTIPQYTTNSQIALGVGDTNTGGTCAFTGNIATCTNIPTGPDKGNQIIYAQLSTSAKTNTGRTGELIKIFQDSSVPGSLFNCASVAINTTTTCTFNFPAFEALDPAFGIKIGNSTLVKSCVVSGLTATCTGVNTGASSGDQVIFAGTTAQIDTGETVFVTRSLVQSDMSNLAQLVTLTCTPNPIAVFSNTTCAGTLPNFVTTTNTTLKLKINGESEVTCTITGKALRCAGLPSGSNAGDKSIQVSLDGGNFEDTGLFVTVSNKIIGDNELSIIGDPSKTQILTQFKCGINDIVYAGKTTTCTIQVAPGWVMFPGLKMSIEIDPPQGKCSQNGTTITCINVPVTEDISDPGVLFLVNKSGQTIFIGVTYKVQAAPAGFVYVAPANPVISPTTPTPPTTGTPQTGTTVTATQPSATSVKETTRSGGLSIVLLLLLFSSWAILFYTVFVKRKNINK
jgi:Regulator of chromosome condensation (RCC1) repeat